MLTYPIKIQHTRQSFQLCSTRRVKNQRQDHVGERTDKRQPRSFIKKEDFKPAPINSCLDGLTRFPSQRGGDGDMTTDCKSG